MRLALIVCFGLFSWLANAQPEPPKKTKEELQQISLEADASYQAKDYKQALTGYLLLYQETQLSDMLFNIAQCQRALHRYTNSIESYNAYLAAQPGSPRRSAINEVLVLMKDQLKKQAEERARLKRRNTVLSGSFLLAGLASGAASFAITQKAKNEGDAPPVKRAEAILFGAFADASLITSGVFLFFVLKPKKPTYTLELSLTPSQAFASLRF